MTLYDELEEKVERGETTWQEIYEYIQKLLAMREMNDYIHDNNYE